MGEYADAMIGGTCCRICGVFLSGGDGGYPMLCSTCARDERQSKRTAPASSDDLRAQKKREKRKRYRRRKAEKNRLQKQAAPNEASQ
jgi:hypothetical protein